MIVLVWLQQIIPEEKKYEISLERGRYDLQEGRGKESRCFISVYKYNISLKLSWMTDIMKQHDTY